MFLLDTNTCSYILRRKPPAVHERFRSLPSGEIGVSSIVAAELCYGAARHPHGRKIQAEIDDLLTGIEVFSWDEAAARVYGSLRANLEKRGQLIGGLDLQIAAHALTLDAILVTNNEREFRRVPKLRLENWIAK